MRVMATRSVSLVTLGGMVVVYVARELPPGEKEDKSWRTKKKKKMCLHCLEQILAPVLRVAMEQTADPTG